MICSSRHLSTKYTCGCDAQDSWWRTCVYMCSCVCASVRVCVLHAVFRRAQISARARSARRTFSTPAVYVVHGRTADVVFPGRAPLVPRPASVPPTTNADSSLRRWPRAPWTALHGPGSTCRPPPACSPRRRRAACANSSAGCCPPGPAARRESAGRRPAEPLRSWCSDTDSRPGRRSGFAPTRRRSGTRSRVTSSNDEARATRPPTPAAASRAPAWRHRRRRRCRRGSARVSEARRWRRHRATSRRRVAVATRSGRGRACDCSERRARARVPVTSVLVTSAAPDWAPRCRRASWDWRGTSNDGRRHRRRDAATRRREATSADRTRARRQRRYRRWCSSESASSSPRSWRNTAHLTSDWLMRRLPRDRHRRRGLAGVEKRKTPASLRPCRRYRVNR